MRTLVGMGRRSATPSRGGHLTLREADAIHAECRGEAMGTSSRRLRWQLRRLPAHGADEATRVRRQAIQAELTQRGEA